MTNNNLFDGVPAHMEGSLRDYVFAWTTQRSTPSVSRIREIERYLQVSFAPSGERATILHKRLMAYVTANGTQGIDVAEAIIATNNNADSTVRGLNRVLIESGSKWIAVKSPSGSSVYAHLDERVEATATEAFELLTNNNANAASDFMKQAWSSAFGRSPNPSLAYSSSIKAIEAAVWPIILPNNQRSTLGDLIREIDNNQGKWHTSITETVANEGMDSINAAMKVVWHGQTDRHGTANPIIPSQQAAEQAIFAALYICSVFNRNLVS